MDACIHTSVQLLYPVLKKREQNYGHNFQLLTDLSKKQKRKSENPVSTTTLTPAFPSQI